MDFSLSISKLDKKQYFLIGITASIAVLAMFYWFYYEPSQQAIAVLRQEIATKSTEMNTTLTNATLINKLGKRVPELEEQIEVLRQKTASSAEIIPLISTMEEEAQRLDLKFLNMVTNVQEPLSPDQRKVQGQDTPAGETSEYTKIVITINLLGRYKKIEEFIRTLQIIAPFLVIDEVNIRAEEETYPELQARLVIKAYSREGDSPDVIAGEF